MSTPLPYDPSSAIASPVEILRVTADHAFPDVELFYRHDGRLRSLHELPSYVARVVNGVDVVERNGKPEVMAIHLGTRGPWLRLLFRCLGMSPRRAAALARAQPPVPRVLRPREPADPLRTAKEHGNGEAGNATHER